ncbi:glucoside xylosyltransferase 2-like [Polypterus senegalus]|uniref:glucoside xylosyltransferase 2-like n=1 Tax=Polypterus senegalus TaxID=55291 RepID=UPI0019655C36|nr:glucoside xylosyltransferase 2-like [Polypterus senegalus]
MRAYSKTLVLSTFFVILLVAYFFARRDALLKEEWNGGSLRDVGSAVTFHPPLLRDTQQETRRRQKLTKILSGSKKITRKHPKQFSTSMSHKGPMHLALVACRNHLEEALTMMKSALLFSNRKIMFHIFTEDSIKLMFETRLKQWLNPLSSKFQYNIREITFSIKDAEEWKKIFQPCAAQRLFLPIPLL